MVPVATITGRSWVMTGSGETHTDGGVSTLVINSDVVSKRQSTRPNLMRRPKGMHPVRKLTQRHSSHTKRRRNSEEGNSDGASELHSSRLFSFEDVGGGAAQAAGGAGTIYWFNVVGMLGNLWWSMQLQT